MDALALLKEVSRKEGVKGRIVEALDEASRIIGSEAESLDDKLIEACLGAPEGLAEACCQLIEAGGKRIRPTLCLLAFRAAGGQTPLPMDLAVVCELLHNATLLHDDVIDEGELRRGRPAVRVVHGNAVSVLGGDYLLVRTVEMISARGSRFIDLYTETMKQLINGELVQLQRRGSTGTTKSDYFRIIEGKTASLFRWASCSGALAAGIDEARAEKLGQFGWHVGMAFQIMDDVLDFSADATQLGKSLLADIGEGKMTLPVILASKKSSQVVGLLDRMLQGEESDLIAPKVAELVHSTGAVAESKKRASEHTEQALDTITSLSGLEGNSVRVLDEITRALLEREL
jgi:octaprenyl-diphosphate synthase